LLENKFGSDTRNLRKENLLHRIQKGVKKRKLKSEKFVTYGV